MIFALFRSAEDGMKYKMRKSLLIAVVLLFAAMVMVPTHAAPKNVYYVDDDGGYDFTTIQAAIDACVSGDKIHVYAGEYTENLVIDVSITLTGEDPATTIIDGGGGSNCIYVDNVMVRITGFTIMDGRTNGIYLDDSCAGSIIIGNTITGNGQDGIFMLGSDECTIKGNTIENNGYYGIYMRIDCDDNEIIGNTITGNYYENIFIFSGCDRNLVKGNKISYSETSWGIRIWAACDDNEIIGNTITGNYLANIYIYNDCPGNLVQGNEISYSETGQGIFMNYLCDESMIIGNEITDNAEEGIRMSGTPNSEISRNYVLRNGNYGIDLEYNDDYNTIKNNVALDNTTYDLYQDSTSDFNTWARNTYGTSSIN
jgi:parallel beta-helix repeat protein